MFMRLVFELRLAWRMLARAPLYAWTVIGTLALGIGGTSAIFSMLYAVVLRPLPFEHTERLFAVRESFSNLQLASIPLSPREYLDLRQTTQTFDAVSAHVPYNMNLTQKGVGRRVQAVATTADVFRVLGIPAALGRTYTREEETPGHAVALLSWHFFQQNFAGDTAILGKSLELDGVTTTVIGVLPAAYDEPFDAKGDQTQSRGAKDIWVPLTFTADQTQPTARGGRYLTVLARLRPGATRSQAEAELGQVRDQFLRTFPVQYGNLRNYKLFAVPLTDYVLGASARVLWFLFGAALLVLMAACANIVSLTLARLATRRREIAVRVAVGANSSRIVQQFLTESVLLACAGGAFGILLSQGALDFALRSWPDAVPRTQNVGLNIPVLLFAVLLCGLTGIAVGVLPALQASRADPGEVLKEGARSSGGKGVTRLRRAIVAVQVALSLILLVGAGVLLKSFITLTRTSPGFDPEQVVTARVVLDEVRYAGVPEQTRYREVALERLRALPGVTAVGITSILPLDGWSDFGFRVEGAPEEPHVPTPAAQVRLLAGDYFDALRIRRLEGRLFGVQDQDLQAPRVAIVNARLAKRYLGADPLSKRIVRMDALGRKDIYAVVGVVADGKDVGLEREVEPALYIPAQQFRASGGLSFVVRSSAPEPSALAAVRSALSNIDPTQPVFAVEPMQTLVDETLGPRRLVLTLVGAFAALGTILAVLGVHGVTAYGVARRTQELGVRRAFGADEWAIVRLVLFDTGRAVGVGLALGLMGSVALVLALRSFAYGGSAWDPTILSYGLGLLLGTACVAALLPALQAASVDLVQALRSE